MAKSTVSDGGNKVVGLPRKVFKFLGLPSLLLLLITGVKGYMNINDGKSFFGYAEIDCGNKIVVKSLAELIESKAVIPDVKVHSVTTDAKDEGFRSCFALIDVPAFDVKNERVDYQVRRTDDKKSFTIYIEP